MITFDYGGRRRVLLMSMIIDYVIKDVRFFFFKFSVCFGLTLLPIFKIFPEISKNSKKILNSFLIKMCTALS